MVKKVKEDGARRDMLRKSLTKICFLSMSKLFNTIFVLAVFFQLPYWSNSTGILEVKLINFSNPNGNLFTGSCCDPRFWLLPCYECDHTFRICLDDNVASSNMKSCGIGKYKTGVIKSNIIDFQNVKNLQNPMIFQIKRWPSLLNLKISVLDFDDVNIFQRVDYMGYYIKLKRTFETQKLEPKILNLKGTVSSIFLQLKMYCNQNFYGSTCKTYCIPTNSEKGHYKCDKNTGRKKCNIGWTGENCLMNQDDCLNNRCHHAATCLDGITYYTCLCPPERTGTICNILLQTFQTPGEKIELITTRFTPTTRNRIYQRKSTSVSYDEYSKKRGDIRTITAERSSLLQVTTATTTRDRFVLETVSSHSNQSSHSTTLKSVPNFSINHTQLSKKMSTATSPHLDEASIFLTDASIKVKIINVTAAETSTIVLPVTTEFRIDAPSDTVILSNVTSSSQPIFSVTKDHNVTLPSVLNVTEPYFISEKTDIETYPMEYTSVTTSGAFFQTDVKDVSGIITPKTEYTKTGSNYDFDITGKEVKVSDESINVTLPYLVSGVTEEESTTMKYEIPGSTMIRSSITDQDTETSITTFKTSTASSSQDFFETGQTVEKDDVTLVTGSHLLARELDNVTMAPSSETSDKEIQGETWKELEERVTNVATNTSSQNLEIYVATSDKRTGFSVSSAQPAVTSSFLLVTNITKEEQSITATPPPIIDHVTGTEVRVSEESFMPTQVTKSTTEEHVKSDSISEVTYQPDLTDITDDVTELMEESSFVMNTTKRTDVNLPIEYTVSTFDHLADDISNVTAMETNTTSSTQTADTRLPDYYVSEDVTELTEISRTNISTPHISAKVFTVGETETDFTVSSTQPTATSPPIIGTSVTKEEQQSTHIPESVTVPFTPIKDITDSVTTNIIVTSGSMSDVIQQTHLVTEDDVTKVTEMTSFTINETEKENTTLLFDPKVSTSDLLADDISSAASMETNITTSTKSTHTNISDYYVSEDVTELTEISRTNISSQTSEVTMSHSSPRQPTYHSLFTEDFSDQFNTITEKDLSKPENIIDFSRENTTDTLKQTMESTATLRTNTISKADEIFYTDTKIVEAISLPSESSHDIANTVPTIPQIYTTDEIIFETITSNDGVKTIYHTIESIMARTETPDSWVQNITTQTSRETSTDGLTKFLDIEPVSSVSKENGYSSRNHETTKISADEGKEIKTEVLFSTGSMSSEISQFIHELDNVTLAFRGKTSGKETHEETISGVTEEESATTGYEITGNTIALSSTDRDTETDITTFKTSTETSQFSRELDYVTSVFYGKTSGEETHEERISSSVVTVGETETDFSVSSAQPTVTSPPILGTSVTQEEQSITATPPPIIDHVTGTEVRVSEESFMPTQVTKSTTEEHVKSDSISEVTYQPDLTDITDDVTELMEESSFVMNTTKRTDVNLPIEYTVSTFDHLADDISNVTAMETNTTSSTQTADTRLPDYYVSEDVTELTEISRTNISTPHISAKVFTVGETETDFTVSSTQPTATSAPIHGISVTKEEQQSTHIPESVTVPFTPIKDITDSLTTNIIVTSGSMSDVIQQTHLVTEYDVTKVTEMTSFTINETEKENTTLLFDPKVSTSDLLADDISSAASMETNITTSTKSTHTNISDYYVSEDVTELTEISRINISSQTSEVTMSHSSPRQPTYHSLFTEDFSDQFNTITEKDLSKPENIIDFSRENTTDTLKQTMESTATLRTNTISKADEIFYTDTKIVEAISLPSESAHVIANTVPTIPQIYTTDEIIFETITSNDGVKTIYHTIESIMARTETPDSLVQNITTQTSRETSTDGLTKFLDIEPVSSVSKENGYSSTDHETTNISADEGKELKTEVLFSTGSMSSAISQFIHELDNVTSAFRSKTSGKETHEETISGVTEEESATTGYEITGSTIALSSTDRDTETDITTFKTSTETSQFSREPDYVTSVFYGKTSGEETHEEIISSSVVTVGETETDFSVSSAQPTVTSPPIIGTSVTQEEQSITATPPPIIDHVTGTEVRVSEESFMPTQVTKSTTEEHVKSDSTSEVTYQPDLTDITDDVTELMEESSFVMNTTKRTDVNLPIEYTVSTFDHLADDISNVTAMETNTTSSTQTADTRLPDYYVSEDITELTEISRTNISSQTSEVTMSHSSPRQPTYYSLFTEDFSDQFNTITEKDLSKPENITDFSREHTTNKLSYTTESSASSSSDTIITGKIYRSPEFIDSSTMYNLTESIIINTNATHSSDQITTTQSIQRKPIAIFTKFFEAGTNGSMYKSLVTSKIINVTTYKPKPLQTHSDFHTTQLPIENVTTSKLSSDNKYISSTEPISVQNITEKIISISSNRSDFSQFRTKGISLSYNTSNKTDLPEREIVTATTKLLTTLQSSVISTRSSNIKTTMLPIIKICISIRIKIPKIVARFNKIGNRTKLSKRLCWTINTLSMFKFPNQSFKKPVVTDVSTSVSWLSKYMIAIIPAKNKYTFFSMKLIVNWVQRRLKQFFNFNWLNMPVNNQQLKPTCIVLIIKPVVVGAASWQTKATSDRFNPVASGSVNRKQPETLKLQVCRPAKQLRTTTSTTVTITTRDSLITFKSQNKTHVERKTIYTGNAPIVVRIGSTAKRYYQYGQNIIRKIYQKNQGIFQKTLYKLSSLWRGVGHVTTRLYQPAVNRKKDIRKLWTNAWSGARKAYKRTRVLVRKAYKNLAVTFSSVLDQARSTTSTYARQYYNTYRNYYNNYLTRVQNTAQYFKRNYDYYSKTLRDYWSRYIV